MHISLTQECLDLLFANPVGAIVLILIGMAIGTILTLIIRKLPFKARPIQVSSPSSPCPWGLTGPENRCGLPAAIHDMITPVQNIAGCVELLALQSGRIGTIGTSSPPKATGPASLMDDILSESRRFKGMVEQLSRTMASAATPLPIMEEEVDLQSEIQAALHRQDVSARVKGLSLTLKIHSPLPELVLLDRRRLNQILENLLSNAIHYTKTGGVTLECTTVQGRGDAQGLRFLVRDTGPGIALSDGDRLFGKFQRSDRSREGLGMGMGLFLARGAARDLGGDIFFTSEQPGGSTFAAIIYAGRTRPTPKTPAQLRILIVEDNSTCATVLSHYLDILGATSTQASNCQAAIQAFREGDFDLVLMDLSLPDGSGQKTAEEMRRIHRQTSREGSILEIIAVTADGLSPEQMPPFDSVLKKPVQISDLETVLTGHISSQ